MFRIALLLLFLSSAAKALDFFGYVGVMCDFDDPLDDTTLTDYSAEVAGFTNINHVCLPADPANWADRISQANAQFRPLLSVEGAFDFAGAGPDGPESRTVWPVVRNAVKNAVGLGMMPAFDLCGHNLARTGQPLPHDEKSDRHAPVGPLAVTTRSE